MIESILLIIGVVLIVIAVVLAALAADEVDKANKDEKDKELDRAKQFLIWSAVVNGIAGIIALLIAIDSRKGFRRFSRIERETYFLKSWVRGAMFLAFIGAAVAGGLAWAAEREMKKSKIGAKVERTASGRAKTTATISWGAAAIILVAIFFTFGRSNREEVEAQIGLEQAQESRVGEFRSV